MPSQEPETASAPVSTWRYPKTFWIANGVELFERAAYYGTFIALALFLTDVVGFTDVEAGWIGAGFASLIYLLPFVSGAAADRIGFRYALVIAFLLLGIGYATLGLYPAKGAVLASLALICVGGSIVKPTIAGTVARSSDDFNRARAFSLFYMVVNIGSFSGKTIAKPVRTMLGLEYVPLYSSGAAFIALVLVLIFYWPKDDLEQRPRSAMEAVRDLGQVLRNGRFMALLLITAGFWAIQGQLYASLPKYVIRMVGPDASPEWYANVNPLVVVLLVVPITQLVRKIKPVTSIGISLALIPFSALIMAFSGLFDEPIVIAGYAMHPITVMMVLGIALQGFAECFLSPRYLEFASKQAPPGQEGLYMGYAHLNTFFAWLTGFALSGYLLDAFCPDPKKLEAAGMSAQQIKAAYAHAPYLWYTFVGIGVLAFVALLVFKFVTDRVDRERQARA
ncbi:MAG: MFS transporter [Thermoanaerobaculia bacterium]|nr:MFS transporter [Thermoanaerobaculia bacterium]